MITLGSYWTYFVFVSAESMKTFSLVSASDRLRVRITLCWLYPSTANTRIAVNSKLATIQFDSGTISSFLYNIHYSDNYQHTHVCMLIIIKCLHRNTCPSLSNNGGSHLVSRKRSIDWPGYPRNLTCKNANYVMIHW